MLISTQWLESTDCQGPPSSIYYTSLNNPFVDFVQQEYSIGYCGNLWFPEDKRCCYQSLDMGLSNGVQSGSHFESDFNLKSLPKDANGFQYCLVEGLPLFDGYEKLYLLANGLCVDDKYSCSQSTLYIHNGTGCSHTVARYPIPSLNITNDLGNAYVSLSNLESGENTFVWVSMTPSTFLIPDFKSLGGFETTVLVLYCIAFILSPATVIIYAIKYYKTQSSLIRFKLLLSVFWLLLLIAKFIYWTVSFDWYAIYSEIMCALFGLATLSTSINTAFFINKFAGFTRDWYATVNLAVLISIHIIFAGAWYLDYWRCVTNPWQSFVTQWNTLTLYWILFMFLYDLSPFYITAQQLLWKIKIQHNVPLRQLLYTLVLHQPLLLVLGCCATTLLQSDAHYLTSEGIAIFLLICHALLSCVVLDLMPKLLSMKTFSSSKPSFKAKMVTDSVLVPMNSYAKAPISNRAIFEEPMRSD
ncbi:hypothetical protein EDD86DRAFT_248549 [Gorgonomyces haynaldii]|nr:hypothetical protein EDD86DRAFT_248549 [Gorgonomyces haynaldii]